MGAAFDDIGEDYDASFTDREAQLERGRRLVAALPSGSRVLDHGCGSGLPTARQLVDAGLEVVGVDESARMLELAAARVPEAVLHRRDLRELGPELGDFDAVVSFFALLMLPRAEIPAVLEGIAARLHPSGLLVLGMVAGDLDTVPIPFLGTTLAVSAYPTPALADAVTAAGFVVEECEEVAVPGPGGVETQQFLRARLG